MPTIDIHVKNKIALSPTAGMVCGNSDYSFHFVFDEEWNAHKVKTARFVWNGQFRDVIFEGDTCDAPVISGATVCAVGVFAGNLRTTTPALVTCEKSILCAEGLPEEPEPDVYEQLLQMYEEMMDAQLRGAVLSVNGVKPDEDGNVETEQLVKVERVEVTFAEEKNVNKTNFTTVSWLSYNKVKDCTTARVIFDGVEYVCPVAVRIDFTEYGDESYFYIGNFQDGAPQYPFCFWGYILHNYAIVNAAEGIHTVSFYATKEIVRPIESKYLPKAGAVADADGETVTAAEFNALLSALRAAGYIET